MTNTPIQISMDLKDYLESFKLEFSNINHKLDKIQEDLSNTNIRIERLSGEVKALDERLTGKIEALDERLTGKIEALDERLTGKIEALDERLTGKIEALDERLTGKIEALDEKLSGRINTLDTKVEEMNKRINSQDLINRGILATLSLAVIGGIIKLFFPEFPGKL
jgi:chromosome segregation ATPase